jgi:hypothetical protein
MKRNRNVASAAEMRELINLELLNEYNVGPDWTSYEGAPFHTHIRWNSEGFGFILGTEFEADTIAHWVQTELHTGND